MADEGLIAAAGTVAAGAAILYATAGEVDCNKIKEEIEKLPASKEKLTDASAKARALAMSDYACKYFNAVKENARMNMIIALIQQAASFYIADKQHDIAKQAQRRFDEIWHNQRDKADKLFDHWEQNGKPVEASMLADLSSRQYVVDYETAKNRAIVNARSEFARARDKVRRESNIHCVGATRTALRQLQIAEAKAAVLATNSAIRFEEERKHQRESQYREESFKWASLIQGALTGSSNAIRTAQQAAAAAGSINPYEGWSNSVSSLSAIGGALGNMNGATFGALNAGVSGMSSAGFWGSA
ncbi:hypothetical protein A6B43_08650 [Vespertiliibacter pulmonis]|uniref:Uncharacterized protein n=1 Tax=Vespertiliibacter pulmonis TaxID=1443036 RepID=A0A3N4VXA9_9PAST|nr:hypothetical protein [Vespertiliibacter pulmonis]QLB20053.1 hypothetical protein A6B43_00125 [Vespertiliibacter pulmonis]QLB21589.1 hypothetical protein A6B43_08650 [Vespertiliibacter pulmonis]RPE86013.1 hypothetical protein EDC46_0404 [Vespertiliibacter pulmonis]